MDLMEVFRKRRSIRKYKATPIEKEKLFRVLEAGRLAPSAANKQPWNFIVVDNEEVKKKLFNAYPSDWFVKAPVIIVACANPSLAWKRRDGEEYWKVDLAIAIEHMVLQAYSEGLGACWVCAFNETEVKKVLNIPEEVRVVAMIPIGYPDEEKGEVTNRKQLREIVFMNSWGNTCEELLT
ncbi:MAG: nitroreductase family protein [Thermoproteota archaeon]|nr:nitroreductase family protein [Candidatus Brockarchaeota archaeon]MBO3767969.1 nitroreductase family protein [Candidatus Brockarchaeota archaeon]MBO3802135.1 nitroreductase family protein [Candidatus Brockarchaeota archaeon]